MTEFLEIRTGIYFLCRDQEVVYVGQSRNISQRLYAHNRSKDFDSVLMMFTPQELLNEIEQYWIERIKPKLNARHKIEVEEQRSANRSATNQHQKEFPFEWGGAKRIERHFGITQGKLRKLASQGHIESALIKIKPDAHKGVRLFSFQSIQKFLAASIK